MDFTMDNYPTLKLNSTGNEVKILQQLLRMLGFFSASITGSFDITTENAVKSFQRSKNIDITGIVNQETWNLLINETSDMYRIDNNDKNMDDIVSLQEKLQATLYYDGDINGVYDTETELAVKTFQLNNNILSNGIANSITLSVLNQTYSSLNCNLEEDNQTQSMEYIIKKGDTLYSIANKFNTTVSNLRKLNNLYTDNLIIGEIILVPKTLSDSNTYIVKKGDTLYSISKQFNISVDDLKTSNNLISNTVYIGQQLIIPGTENNEYSSYTVQKGDTLYSISRQFNISVDKLMKANNLSNTVLSIGQILLIPTENNKNYNEYTVQRGDTLYSISKRFNTTVDTIKNINNLANNTLSIGQTLLIPS